MLRSLDTGNWEFETETRWPWLGEVLIDRRSHPARRNLRVRYEPKRIVPARKSGEKRATVGAECSSRGDACFQSPLNVSGLPRTLAPGRKVIHIRPCQRIFQPQREEPPEITRNPIQQQKSVLEKCVNLAGDQMLNVSDRLKVSPFSIEMPE